MIPSSGQKTLSRFESLSTRLPRRSSVGQRLLAVHLARRLVLAQPLERRRAQTAVVRPLDELDLADELGLDPDDVGLAHPRHLRHLGERATSGCSSGRSCASSSSMLRVREPGADVADVDELVAAPDAEHERAEAARAPALAPRVAGDHELLRGRAS